MSCNKNECGGKLVSCLFFVQQKLRHNLILEWNACVSDSARIADIDLFVEADVGVVGSHSENLDFFIKTIHRWIKEMLRDTSFFVSKEPLRTLNGPAAKKSFSFGLKTTSKRFYATLACTTYFNHCKEPIFVVRLSLFKWRRSCDSSERWNYKTLIKTNRYSWWGKSAIFFRSMLSRGYLYVVWANSGNGNWFTFSKWRQIGEKSVTRIEKNTLLLFK